MRPINHRALYLHNFGQSEGDMNSADNLLTQLKDIHLPPAPSIWPLAPGWYALIGIIITGLMIVGVIKYKVYRANRYRKQALKELQQIEANLTDTAHTVESLAILLKRTALVAYPQESVAGLTGEAWLSFLDKKGNTQGFTQGVGRLLISAAYQEKPIVQINDLINLCRLWLSLHQQANK